MTVIRVNGETIEERSIQIEAAAVLRIITDRMQDDPAALQSRAREWAAENLIEAALIRQAAMADPEPFEPPAGCSGETAQRLRLERLLARITSPASPPKRKEIVAHYLKNREAFREPERVRVAHIVKNVDELHDEASALAAIERAQEELARGRPFSEVADEMSDCPGNGGKLDWFPRGEMVEAFEESVFSMSPNQVSGIIRTEFGFHIVKLLDRRPEGIRHLEEVEDSISEMLLQEKRQKRLHQYVDSLRARSVIERGETQGQ